MTLALFQTIVGFIVLGWSASWLVSGASSLAKHFGLSKFTIGITVVALVTSVPEMAVSAIAAFSGNPNISVGNIVGSNIANTALVLPFSCLVHTMVMPKLTLKRELPIVLGTTILAYILMLDGSLSRIDGLILILGFLCFTGWLLWLLRKNVPDVQEFGDLSTPNGEVIPIAKSLGYIAVGLLLIAPSAAAVIEGVKVVAAFFHISTLFVGLFITAVGTSLPELATTVASIMKREKGILIGNIIGSNIYNLLVALPIATIVRPAHFDRTILFRDIPFLIGITILVMLLGKVGKNPRVMTRWKSALLLFLYTCYILYIGFAEISLNE